MTKKGKQERKLEMKWLGNGKTYNYPRYTVGEQRREREEAVYRGGRHDLTVAAGCGS